MNESKRTALLCRELESIGAITLPHYAGNIYSARGWPDRWIAHRMWHGWLEFKGEYGTVSALQRSTIHQIWARTPGGVFVVYHKSRVVERPVVGGSDFISISERWDGTAKGLLKVLAYELKSAN